MAGYATLRLLGVVPRDPQPLPERDPRVWPYTGDVLFKAPFSRIVAFRRRDGLVVFRERQLGDRYLTGPLPTITQCRVGGQPLGLVRQSLIGWREWARGASVIKRVGA